MKNKVCNRILAMLLTLVTLLTVLPISAFADTWLDVEGETQQNGNVSSSDVTVTLSAKDLLTYIKNGDMQGLIDGIAVDGLKGIFTKEELYEIIPAEKFEAIIDAVISDISAEMLLEYIDLGKLLAGIEKSKLIALVQNVKDLQGYIKDYDALMGYIDEDAVAEALHLINVDQLVEDYSNDLVELALELTPNELAAIVDIDAAIHLDGVDFKAAINTAYIENEIGFDTLFAEYIDEEILHDFIVDHYNDDRWSVEHLHAYTNDSVIEDLLHDDAHKDALPSYVHKPQLQALIKSKNIDYATLKAKNLLNETALIDAFKIQGYASFEAYMDQDLAQDVLDDVFTMVDFAHYWENGALNLEKLFDEQQDRIPYNELINQAIDVDALLFDDASAYSVTKLIEKDIVDVANMIGANALFTIDELEEAGVVDYKEILFGDPVRNLDALLTVGDLLDNNVFNRKEMLEGVYDENGQWHDPLFSLGEMITEDIVLIEEMAADGHSYDHLADIVELENQLLDLMHAGRLTSKQIANCIKKDANGHTDYAAAIRAIGGVPAVIAETSLTYQLILTNYVTDFDALMQELGLESIIDRILADGKLQTIFDIKGLINAIGVKKLIELVDLKELVLQIYENNGIKPLLKALTPDKYIRCMNDILNTLSRNVQEIKINGVAITEKPTAALLLFDSEKLFAAIQKIVPTLEDLANLGDDGEVLAVGFSITYASDATGGENKTKEVNLSVQLDGGVDKVRAAAKKLQQLLDRFLTYSYSNGDLTVQVDLPTEFASAIRRVLEELATDADPELVALKDELLALYDANLSDTANFFNNITLHQVVTILDKIDPATFSKAYNKIMTHEYVEVVLDLLKELTGRDLSGVTPEDIVNKLANLPTVPTAEQIVAKVEEIIGEKLLPAYNKVKTLKYIGSALELLEEVAKIELSDVTPEAVYNKLMDQTDRPTVQKIAQKVEEITGRDLLSKLPENFEEADGLWDKVEGELLTDVFSKLAAKAGIDVDLQQLLEEAAASDDPFGYLYTTFVNVLENSESVYNGIKSRVMKVFDRLIASEIGEKLDTYTVAEFYRGNGMFSFDKSLTFSPKKVLEKGVEKLINFALSKRQFNTEYIDQVLDIVYAMITDGTVSVGIDASVLVKDLYEAAFYDEKGNLIDTVFLPAGTELALMQDYVSENPVTEFLSWKDAVTGEIYKDMPQKDVHLIPELDDGMFDIVILNPEDMSVAGIIKLPEGETLEAYEAEMLAILKSKTKLKDTDTVEWLVVVDGVITTQKWSLTDVVPGDMALVWDITPETPVLPIIHTVTVVNPTTGEETTFEVEDGDSLLALEDELNTLAGATADRMPTWHKVVDGVTETEAYDLATPVTEDLTITWSYPALPPQPPVVHTVTVVNPTTGEETTFEVEDGDSLLAIEDELNILAGATADRMPTWHKVVDGVTETEAYDLATPVTEDLTITWSYTEIPPQPPVFHTVTVVTPSGEFKESFEIKDGDNLLALEETLNGYAGATENYKPSWFTVVENVRDVRILLSAAVHADMTITWHYPVITVEVYEPDFTTDKVGTETYTVSANTLLGAFKDLHDGDFQTYIDHMDAWMAVIFDTFHTEWLHADGTALNVNFSVQDDITIRVNIVKDHENANLKLEGADYGHHYDITFRNNTYYLTWDDADWASSMNLAVSQSMLDYCVANGYGLVMDSSDENGHSIELNAALVAALAEKLASTGLEYANLVYTGGKDDSFAGAVFTDAEYFSFIFKFGDEVDGSFFGDGVATIRIPYAGKNVTNSVKTFLYIDGVESPLTIGADAVTLTTTHFSDFTLVDKYYLSYKDSHLWSSDLSADLSLPTLNGQLVTELPIAEGWYAEGEELTHGTMKWTASFNGLALVYTAVVGTNVTLVEGDTFEMPASAVELQHTVTAKVYYIYFYVDGKYDSHIDYTKFSTDIPTWDEIAAHAPTATVAGEWEWYGINDSLVLASNPQDVYLFLVRESAIKDFTITFALKDQDGNVITSFDLTYTVEEWMTSHLAGLNDEILAKLADLNDPTKAIVWMNGDKALTDYTLADWEALLTSDATSVAFEATYTDRAYTVYTDGNVTLDLEGNSAIAGTVITVTPIEKLGMHATVTVMINGAKVTLADGKFTMQAADAYITVTYTPMVLTYVDVNGTTVDATYGTQVLYQVTIPAGYTLMQDITALKEAPKGLTLISTALNDNGELVLTYAFTLTEETADFNLKAFNAKVQDVINALIYQKIYILNGKQYATEADAIANLPEGVAIKEWKQGIYKNLYFASLEYLGEDGTASLIVLIVVLVLLVLILLIALFYTLYICGKLKPNWFLKGITAIVSAFFAVCMAVAAAGLAIARFFGHREEDMMEDTIELNSDENDLSAYADASEAVEETAEEATEEAIEEAAEEATEEATEEAEEDGEESEVDVIVEAENAEVEVNVSTDVEDAIEVTVEEPVEVAETEAAIEEATEEATEETAETDEVAAVVAETVNEVVAEATAEEAVEETVVEEATEEASEEDETKKNETNE